MTIPISRVRPRTILSVDFGTLARSNGAYSLPSGLTLTCATINRTAQQSAATILTGFGANAARSRSVDGTAWGLSLESSRRQYVTDTRLDQWGNGLATVTSAVDPTTGSSLCSVNSDGASGFRILGVPLPAGSVVLSAWIKVLAPAPTTIARANSNVAGAIIDRSTVDATWARRDATGTALAQTYNSIIQPRVSAEAGSMLVYGYQIEAAHYPGSVTLTTGAAVTRAADVLSTPGADVAGDGYFDELFTLAPNYADTEFAADHDWTYFGGPRLYLRQSDKKLVLHTGGVDVVSSALTWSRNQAITVRAKHQASGRSLTVSGATTGNGTTTGSADSPFTVPGSVYLLGNASGPQECADLRSITFFLP